jgi:hypothetical protein
VPGAGDEGGTGRRLVALCLVVALLLAGLAAFTLGLSIAFGPTGFGGDRTPSRSDELRAAVALVAGVTALVLGAAAFVSAASLPIGRRRGRVVVAIVVAQASAVLVLVGSTMV